MSKKNEKAVIRAAMALTVAMLASGCGGSGETETAEPSADQKAFEALILAPGASYGLSWNLPYSGTPVSGTHHALSDFASLPASPAGGAQKTTQAPRVNLAKTLAMPPAAPSRFLKDGTVLVVPDAELSHVTRYVGADVLVDTLANDGRTVAHTQRRSGFATVPLAGLVGAAPAELAHWYNSFWSNTLILDATRSFLPGAAFVTYTATNVGDRYAVFDCTTVTTNANVSPCASGTTLELALVSGIRSNSDGRTYGPTDGNFGAVAADGTPLAGLPALDPILTGVNTFILILSSYTMVRALDAIGKGNQGGLKKWLFATIALGAIAVVASAVIFSAFHYIGPFGDAFTVQSFTFRAIAGLAFSALYVLRGFGLTAWTHALYDVGVMVL